MEIGHNHQMMQSLRPAIILAGLFGLVLSASAQSISKLDARPRIGILVPLFPPDYKLLLDALQDARLVTDGPFTYRTGTISQVPVVLIIQTSDGDLVRSLGAQEMIRDFNIRALIYPGTSGGHLPKGEMGLGDIVLGAKNVNESNYYLSPTGEIMPGAYTTEQPGMKHYGALYADPKLLAMLACSARRMASATVLPGWLEPVKKSAHPQIFYFGIQGASTIWSDNQAYTETTMKIFHAIDEDGDWDSAFVATIHGVPFLEVSVISNSIFTFPNRSHGTPATPAGGVNSHVLAQRLSNRITLDLIAEHGKQILGGIYSEPVESPFPAAYFETPTNPRSLLSGCR